MKAKVAIASCVVLFAVTAAFRFLALKNGFVNDHFVYITGGRQMLLGQWPTRDWIDPGLPLMFAASAFAQRIFGQTLFAEAMLVSIAFGLGAAFTAAAARELTGSLLLGIAASLIEIAVFPRTYSYPKIVAYAFVFWTYGRYIARPSTGRLFAMAAGVAVAFLFRHDHGLFLGAGALLTALLVRQPGGWRTSMRDAGLLTVFIALLVMPYLVYVQAYAGLWTYFRTGVEFSQREAAREWHVWPHVFGDERPLESAMVYELHALPFVAGVVLVLSRRRDEIRLLAARIVPIAVVGFCVNYSFIRDPLGTRLADAIVPAVLLGAWLLRRSFALPRIRLIAAPAAAAYVALFAASVLAVGFTHDEIDRAGLLGRRQEIPRRFVERSADLRSRFVDYQIPTPAARSLVPFFKYVDRCTSPDDRLLIGGFLVEVPFYSRRLFAAGQEYFGAYFGSDANEQFAYAHLQRERVPFAILPSDDLDEFNSRFPLVAGYVHDRFVPLTDVRVSDEQTIHILVNRGLAYALRDRETGWPCVQ